MDMIRVENLDKTFTLHLRGGVALPVLRDTSLAVAAGECVTLHGPSGAGKSTLLRSIYGNYRPQTGHVLIRHDGELIGMGRVVGDGGLFLFVVDIAVTPAWQGQGLGKRIMQALMDEVHARAPARTMVGLIADGKAHQLYEKFGFRLTAPGAQGMLLRL